jgi:hypothetical protein
MCEKLKYCATKIDPCLVDEIKSLNELGFKTISSCCGHGKYNATVLVRTPENLVYEIYSDLYLTAYNPKKKKRDNRYYKKDSEGIYHIPDLAWDKI